VGALVAATLAGGAAQTVNLNCGGAAFTASDGTQWSGDSYYSGGDLLYTGYSIVGVQPQDYYLYRTARAGLYGDFSYSIPLPNGTYTVTLLFAEIQYSAIGQRVFNVAINGSTVLNNFDILAHVPVLTPFPQQFTANVTNGVLQMDFTGVTRRALVSAIRVAPASGSSPTPVLTVSGTALSFAGTAGGANPAAQTATVSTTASWTAASNASWLTVSPGSGTGNGSLSIGANLAGLAVGNYTGTITVTAPGATGSPQTIAVSLAITAAAVPPGVSAAPASLSFGATAGGANPSSQTITISNSGGGTLNWTAAKTQPWLVLGATSGSGTSVLSVQAVTGSLAAGTYSDTVTISGAGANPASQTVAVTFTVASAVGPPPSGTPLISINCGGSATTGADGTNWTADQYYTGGDLLYTGYLINGTQDLYVYRTGRRGLYGNFSYTVPVPNGSYTLKLKFAESTYGSKGQRVFNVNVNGSPVLTNFDIVADVGPLMADDKQFPVMVTNGTLQIDFIGVVGYGMVNGIQVLAAGSTPAPTPTPTPTLSLSTSSLSFAGTAGGANPPGQSVTVSNAGTGTLTWTAASNQSWLAVSPGAGTNSGSLSVSVTIGALAAGSYTGTVTVNGGAAGSATVDVGLTIAAGQAGTPPPPSGGNSWFVTTTGSPGGDGSGANPWDLATALAGPRAVKPGDTIWVHGGRYGGGQYNSVIYSSLVGTPGAPIIVRAYPGERATIDAWLQIGCCDGAPNPAAGSYTWFWGLEFAGFNPDRTTAASGPPAYNQGANHNSADTWAAGTKFINCIVHDTAAGFSAWNAANSEVAGNIIYNVGGYGPDRGHGHLMYLQNQAPSALALNDNIGFNNFDMGIQAYGSGTNPYVQNMTFSGNVIFNAGVLYGKRADNILIGGGIGGPSGIAVRNNVFYNPPSASDGFNELGYPWTARAGDLVATGNYFIGGLQAVDLERWQTMVFQNNTIYSQYSQGEESIWILGSGQSTANYQVGGNQYFGNGSFMIFPGCDGWPCANGQGLGFSAFQAATGLDLSSTYNPGGPTGLQSFVRPNAYEPGRANIVILNWNLQGSVLVDVSASGIKMGDRYQIRDAQNWYGGAVASGMYSGAPVTIPMTGLVLAQPVGSVPNPATHTAPLFGTFVLLSGAALTNTY
jgi:hypothetical protein